MTSVIDIHTHSVPPRSEQAIVNHMVGVGSMPAEAVCLSVGIHPWHIAGADVPQLMSELRRQLADERVVAIGEAGIDKLCSTPLDVQRELFVAQAMEAESRGLPLILHVVRSHAEVLQLHRDLRPSVPWIVHGFRGKPELARQYTSRGIYLSFGEHFNAVSLALAYASGTFFAESDEALGGIDHIYQLLSSSLAADALQLKQCVTQNVERIFF
jgi:TatD DNase family protein